MKALFLVDVQNDFLPGGALPAPRGNQIIPEINRIMDQFELVFASRDWHPEDSIHFNHWPPHCIRNTAGAAYPDDLDTGKIEKEFLEGTGNIDDGYSAFEATTDNLNEYLKKRNITGLYLAGLTTEYCVKATALDALRNGYQTYVIASATAGVEARPEDEQKAYSEMETAGVLILNSL